MERTGRRCRAAPARSSQAPGPAPADHRRHRCTRQRRRPRRPACGGALRFSL